VAALRQVNESVTTIDEYLDAVRPVLERMSNTEERVIRRAIGRASWRPPLCVPICEE